MVNENLSSIHYVFSRYDDELNHLFLKIEVGQTEKLFSMYGITRVIQILMIF